MFISSKGPEVRQLEYSVYSHWLVTFIYLFFPFFISWRLITLQYCSGFCHTLK